MAAAVIGRDVVGVGLADVAAAVLEARGAGRQVCDAFVFPDVDLGHGRPGIRRPPLECDTDRRGEHGRPRVQGEVGDTAAREAVEGATGSRRRPAVETDPVVVAGPVRVVELVGLEHADGPHVGRRVEGDLNPVAAGPVRTALGVSAAAVVAVERLGRFGPRDGAVSGTRANRTGAQGHGPESIDVVARLVRRVRPVQVDLGVGPPAGRQPRRRGRRPRLDQANHHRENCRRRHYHNHHALHHHTPLLWLTAVAEPDSRPHELTRRNHTNTSLSLGEGQESRPMAVHPECLQDSMNESSPPALHWQTAVGYIPGVRAYAHASRPPRCRGRHFGAACIITEYVYVTLCLLLCAPGQGRLRILPRKLRRDAATDGHHNIRLLPGLHRA
ncbi:MAG: hypothetical protein BWZ02_00165 [Lentisphaerae bacterium ADurb.BinA184]|nr:MAG: hypothetical protein BWZ02_00165 [Lentisphaerae bacterium ADurb.BinA184]